MSRETPDPTPEQTVTWGQNHKLVCERFTAGWKRGERPRIGEFLGGGGTHHTRDLLVELVRIDLEYRWRSSPGETVSSHAAAESTARGPDSLPACPRVEDYAERYPALAEQTGIPEVLIHSEYVARHRWGDRPGHEEYLQRFPELPGLREKLAKLDEGLGAEVNAALSPQPGGTVTPPLPSTTVDRFVENLSASGLMSVEEASSFCKSLPPDSEPEDGWDLAQRLVAADKLTAYQAEKVCRGETKTLAFGEYVVLDQIGAGGMGQVLKARHRTMGRLVALKMISPKIIDSEDSVKRFHREVRAAARLIHPNIVTAFDASEHEGVHFLAMEYVHGEDLGQVMKRRGPLPVDEAVDIIVQAARGLQYAHEQGIVHRDIKPGNLLLGGDGIVKILDMGLARLENDTDDECESRELTGSSQVMGTCDYMAPEQALDTHSADARSDIYSLGCTMYRLLTGDPPYPGNTLTKRLIAHRESSIPSLRQRVPEVSPALEVVFQKMLAKRPDNRQQSVGEVIADLEVCLGRRAPIDSPTASFAASAVERKSPEDDAKGGETATSQAKADGQRTRRRGSRPTWYNKRLVLVCIIIGGLLLVAGAVILAKRFSPSSSPIARQVKNNDISAIESEEGKDVGSASISRTAEPMPEPLPEGCVRRFEGHTSVVNGVAFTNDGKQVVSSSDDGTVRVWDIGTGEEVRQLSHEGLRKKLEDPTSFSCLALSPDGRYCFAGAGNEPPSIVQWDFQSGLVVREMEGHEKRVFRVVANPAKPLIASAGFNAAVILWNLDDGRLIRKWDANSTGRPTCLAFTSDGRLLLVGTETSLIHVYEVESGLELRTLGQIWRGKGGYGPWTQVCISPNGETVYAHSRERVFRAWELETGKELLSFPWAPKTHFARLTPDGQYYVRCSDHDISAFDFNENVNHPVCAMQDRDVFRYFDISRDGQYVTCGCGEDKSRADRGVPDYRVYLWRMPKSVAP